MELLDPNARQPDMDDEENVDDEENIDPEGGQQGASANQYTGGVLTTQNGPPSNQAGLHMLPGVATVARWFSQSGQSQEQEANAGAGGSTGGAAGSASGGAGAPGGGGSPGRGPPGNGGSP